MKNLLLLLLCLFVIGCSTVEPKNGVVVGQTGAQGIQGLQGIQGQQGIQGIQGITGNFSGIVIKNFSHNSNSGNVTVNYDMGETVKAVYVYGMETNGTTYTGFWDGNNTQESYDRFSGLSNTLIYMTYTAGTNHYYSGTASFNGTNVKIVWNMNGALFSGTMYFSFIGFK